MSTKAIIDDGGRAFPYQVSDQSGMDLRDYFAAKAMQSMVLSYTNTDKQEPDNEDIARWSYAMANAMLEARKQ